MNVLIFNGLERVSLSLSFSPLRPLFLMFLLWAVPKHMGITYKTEDGNCCQTKDYLDWQGNSGGAKY